MLASLTIKNIVLIDHLTINFNDGLCALTGETGAGKSILLDSLGLALGARADAGLVRHGEDQASVIASFDIENNHPVSKLIQENDIEFDPSLILRRSLGKDGRSKAFLNDQPISVGLLKKIGEMLVEIHGQFDTHSLLEPANHIYMLDGYANLSIDTKKLKAQWQGWKSAEENLSSIKAQIAKAREEEDYLRTALEDLDNLSIEDDEEEKLTSLRDQLMRREQILESLGEAQTGIQEIDGLSSSVWRALERIGDVGKDAFAAMDRANAEIQEVLSSLQDVAHEVENSEYSLQEIDDRLFALKAQARKHNCIIKDLPQKRDEIAQALNAIENEDQEFSNLIKQVEKLKQEFLKLAQKISQSRQKSSGKLAKLVMAELAPLKLEKARFEIKVFEMSEEQWGERGIDQVRFLVATNPGAEAGALNKVASGGELSRLMLALKVVLAEVGVAGSLVFDEVDSGIGGATAAAVGERLVRLADFRQIMVVTHSPQVAAMAQNHWIVAKGGTKEVKTNIIPLKDMKERQEEIARMLSGAEITSEARAAALKLLDANSNTKNVA